METIVRLPAPGYSASKYSKYDIMRNEFYRVLQNSEIFTLTYGSIVRQLITDLEDLEEVNKQLDTM
jgi:hypothetical protein